MQTYRLQLLIIRMDRTPTRDNAVNGLYWLQHVVTNRDLAVIFLGGHGYLDAKQNFWFLTCEADLTRLRTTAISNDDLLDLIGSIPGKKVLFIDAGHAGLRSATGRASTNPDMDKVINDLSAAGSDLVAFAASTGTEFASENEKWNRHSAFAEALIEAIGEGKASFEPSGRITIDMLQALYRRPGERNDGGASAPSDEPFFHPAGLSLGARSLGIFGANDVGRAGKIRNGIRRGGSKCPCQNCYSAHERPRYRDHFCSDLRCTRRTGHRKLQAYGCLRLLLFARSSRQLRARQKNKRREYQER